MNLQSLYHWFYCLPLLQAAWICAGGCAVMIMARNAYHSAWWWAWFCGIWLIAWAAVVVHLTLLSRAPGTESVVFSGLFDSYRSLFQGGNREILRSNFMNLSLFLPGGLLLIQLMPRRWPRWRRFLPAMAALALLSLSVEWMQLYLMLGQPEADDVLHNSLGAAFGILADVWIPVKRIKI